jgi:hypothetical protein
VAAKQKRYMKEEHGRVYCSILFGERGHKEKPNPISG